MGNEHEIAAEKENEVALIALLVSIRESARANKEMHTAELIDTMLREIRK